MRQTASPPISARRILTRAGVPALLVTNLVNLRYLIGMDCSAGYAIVTASGIDAYLDARYSEAASKRRMPDMRVRSPDQLGEDIAKLKRVGIEADDVTVANLAIWKKKYKNKKFVHTSDVIEHFRRAKSHAELRAVRRASRITRSILRRVPAMLRIGASERDLAWRIASEAGSLGAHGMAFETIVAFGKHTSRPHHRPTDARLKRGEIVQIDMGVVFDGYLSDFSRVYFTGQPTAEQAGVYRVLSRVQRAMIKRVTAGRTNRSLDIEARSMLAKDGFGDEFCHALGHGVGLEIHEGPVLSRKAPLVRLKKNEVVTIEPGLYFPGKWGMRIEDTVIVK